MNKSSHNSLFPNFRNFFGLGILLFFVVPLSAHAAAWQNYRSITVTSNTSLASGTQANFPMLVNIPSSSYLQLIGTGGKVNNASGYDIIFSSTNSCGSPLSFEREQYVASTGELVAWVKVPSLAASSVIYLCYGNTAITTDQSSPTTTWDTNYKGVYHMADNAANTMVTDSTLNGHNGTNIANTSGKTTTGEVSNALNYDGSVDSTNIGANSDFNFTTSNFTVEFLVNRTSFRTDSNQTMISRGAYNGDGYWILDAADGSSSKLIFFDEGSLGNFTYTTTAAINANVWNHLAFVKTGSTASWYINGSVDSTFTSVPDPLSSTRSLYLMQYGDGGGFAPGAMDEARFSNTNRSASWITTEYNNQNNPVTFYTVGNESTPTLIIAPTTLPGSPVNTSYSQTISVTGGGTPYTWSISAGSLPTGLTLNTSSTSSSTTISGTSTGAGTYNFTVQVSSASGSATQAYSIIVANTAPTPPQSLSGITDHAKVDLSWIPPVSDGGSALTHYLVYDRTSGGGSFSLVSTLGPSVITSTVTGLTDGTSYDFEVFAQNTIGTSSASSILTVTPNYRTATSTTGGGNWSSPSTWTGGVVPGDGYFVTIQGPVVINQNIGTSAYGVKNIRLAGSSANLSVDTSASRTILFASTGTDAVGSGSFASPGNDATMFGIKTIQGFLTLVATQAHPITLNSANGTSPIYINKYWASPFVSANVRIYYADLYNLGAGAGNSENGLAWDEQGSDSSNFIDIENCRFTSPYEALFTGQFAGSIKFINNYVTGRSGPKTINIGGNSTGSETITDNTEVSPAVPGVFYSSDYATNGSSFMRNALSGTTTSYLGGFLISGNGTGSGNTIQYNLVYNYPNLTVVGGSLAGANDHNTVAAVGAVSGDTTTMIDSNIGEGEFKTFQPWVPTLSNNFVYQEPGLDQGMFFIEGGQNMNVTHNIIVFVPTSGNLILDDASLNYNNSNGVTYDHNTIIGASGANYGVNSGDVGIINGEGGFQTYNTTIRSNIIGNVSYGIYDRGPNTFTSDYNGVGVHHNDIFSYGYASGYATEGGSTNFDNGVTSHPNIIYGDLDNVNPNFTDATRTSILQYDSRVISGPGTAVDLFTQLGYRSGWGGTNTLGSNPIEDIRQWLFAGYAPTNTALFTSASDGTTIGAVQVPATVPSTPTIGTATVNNPNVTVTFTAPYNGGSVITGYTVTSSPSGGTDSNAGSTSLSHIITGLLINGTTYTFTVHATNSIGNSPESSPTGPAVTLIPVIIGSGGLEGGTTSTSSTPPPITTSTIIITLPPPITTITLTSTIIPSCNNTTGFSTSTGQSCTTNTGGDTRTTLPSAPLLTQGGEGGGNTSYNFGVVTLAQGSVGNAVKELQRFLNNDLHLTLVVDGQLGPKTIAIVKKWQAAHGLKADGIVGPLTKKAMSLSVK